MLSILSAKEINAKTFNSSNKNKEKEKPIPLSKRILINDWKRTSWNHIDSVPFIAEISFRVVSQKV